MPDDNLNKEIDEQMMIQEEGNQHNRNNVNAIKMGTKITGKTGVPHHSVKVNKVITTDNLRSKKNLENAATSSFKKIPNGRRTQRAINNFTNMNLNGLSNNNYHISDEDIDDKISAKIKFPIKLKIILLISFLGIFLLLFMFFLILIGDESSSSSGSLSFNSYYESKCSDVTVIFVDPNNNYEITESKSYTMNDYVAGVVAAEVGGFSNKEVYKTFAVAARTYAEMNLSDECSIEASERMQAFTDITSKSNDNYKLIYEAVEETEGEVVVEDGSLYLTEYDAFCYTSKDSENYILSQQEQKIPVSWVDNNVGNYYYKNCPCEANDQSLTQCFSNGSWTDGGHGRGMSQYGALYLATEMDYTYDQILAYYYGDDIVIASNSFISSVAGLEIKDTTNATALNEQITSFLSSKGSSLDDLNNYVHDSVSSIGAGTREGVVTAAVSMINYLYDNFNTKLPYYWGGRTTGNTIPSNFGTYQPSATSRNGNTYYYTSFDCSGFVSWAIRAGGYNLTNQTSYSFDALYSDDSCVITDSSCIGQPGDLINSPNGHVELIIAVDQDSGKYFIAHSGTAGVVMTQRDMHTGNSSTSTTKVIFMDNYYKNSANINTNY